MALGYAYKIGNGLWIFLFECAAVSVAFYYIMIIHQRKDYVLEMW